MPKSEPTTPESMIALAERIEAKHCMLPLSLAGPLRCGYCSEPDHRADGSVVSWPCDAIQAARALRESAQREAGLLADADASQHWQTRALRAEAREAEGFRRGWEAGREAAAKLCDERVSWCEDRTRFALRSDLPHEAKLASAWGDEARDLSRMISALLPPPTGAETEPTE